jgi:hypothetical protein
MKRKWHRWSPPNEPAGASTGEPGIDPRIVNGRVAGMSGQVHKQFQVPDWYEAGDFEDEPVAFDAPR